MNWLWLVALAPPIAMELYSAFVNRRGKKRPWITLSEFVWLFESKTGRVGRFIVLLVWSALAFHFLFQTPIVP